MRKSGVSLEELHRTRMRLVLGKSVFTIYYLDLDDIFISSIEAILNFLILSKIVHFLLEYGIDRKKIIYHFIYINFENIL